MINTYNIKQYLGNNNLTVDNLLLVINDLVNNKISIEELTSEINSFPACDDYFEGREL